MKKTKGIILAGGRATRLYPVTRGISKQLLPVYDKPMIYYPLSVLLLAGIRDILLISTSDALPRFKALLDSGQFLGINIQYAVQEAPRGIAEAFLIGKEFIGQDRVCLILGDNIFYGHGLSQSLQEASAAKDSVVFGYYVKNPEHYGVIEFDENECPVSIVEKPKNPKSKWAVTGLYFYNHQVVDIVQDLKPSQRGELEITDVNNVYLSNKELTVQKLGRGFAWLDTGTYDSLIDASIFIKTIEERQGLKIGCIEEIAYRQGYIRAKDLLKIADEIKTSYGNYLRSCVT